MTIPRITDHAVLRYMERCHGIDVEHYRRCCEAEIESHLVPGNATIPLEGNDWIIRDGRLVTVLPANTSRTRMKEHKSGTERRSRQFDPRCQDFPDSRRGKWNRHPERGLGCRHHGARADAGDGEGW